MKVRHIKSFKKHYQNICLTCFLVYPETDKIVRYLSIETKKIYYKILFLHLQIM